MITAAGLLPTLAGVLCYLRPGAPLRPFPTGQPLPVGTAESVFVVEGAERKKESGACWKCQEPGSPEGL